MSKETTSPSGTPEQTSGETQKPNNIEALEAKNRELLSELKNARIKNKEFEDRLKAIEDKDLDVLENKGKTVDAAKIFREKYENTKKSLDTTTKKYLLSVANKEIEKEALKMGCIDATAVRQLLDKDDMSIIQVDPETFDVDEFAVKTVLEKMKTKRPYLFKSASTPVKDIPPGRPDIEQDTSKKDKDYSKKSLADLKEELKQVSLKYYEA